MAAKLGIKEGAVVGAVRAPRDYAKLVAPLPKGVRITARASATADLVHLFATKKADLAATLKSFRAKLKPDIPIWVSWPKKSSKAPTDLTEDVIREVALPLGFVDVKVCAVSDVWSGLKLVVRKELR